MQRRVGCDGFLDLITETLISLKNTLEEALAGATNPSNNLA